jgi:hypothetical protein
MLSKLRFSLMMNTTCLMGVVVWNAPLSSLGGRSEVGGGVKGAVRVVVVGPLDADVQAAATSTIAATAMLRLVSAPDRPVTFSSVR